MANITRIKAGDPDKDKKKSQSTASGDRPKTKSTATSVSETPKSTKSKTNPQNSTETTTQQKSIKHPKNQKIPKTSPKSTKKTSRKPLPKPLRIITWPFRMLAKPFIALGRYIHDSWLEIRQVRWPSRSATWKMVLAVFVYAGIFMAFIMLLDALFTFIFNNLLG